MKKITVHQLKSVFRSVFGRSPREAQYNISGLVVQGNELRFLKKEYNKFKPKRTNKINEFREYLESKINSFGSLKYKCEKCSEETGQVIYNRETKKWECKDCYYEVEEEKNNLII